MLLLTLSAPNRTGSMQHANADQVLLSTQHLVLIGVCRYNVGTEISLSLTECIIQNYAKRESQATLLTNT